MARDEKEEKKITALRKEKKEKEEKIRSNRFNRRGKEGFWGFRESYRGFGDGFRDKKFDDKGNNKEGDKFKNKDNIKCYNCQRFGHMARDCTKPQSGGRGRK